MEIVHESPSPDLSFTVRAPLALVGPDGLRRSVERWGLRGFSVDESWGTVPTDGQLVVPFQGVEIVFPVALRHDVDQKFVYFDELTGRQRETLALFYRNLMSGQMAATDEIITSLDTPVDLVPMGETEEERSKGAVGKSPRILRVAYNIAVYVILSYFVFGILGGSVWSRIDTIDVQHGRIDVPTFDLTAADNGMVVATRVAAGTVVKSGDLLIEIRDAKRDADVELARLEMARAQAAYDEVQAAVVDLERAMAPDIALKLRMAKAAMHHMTFFRTTSFEDVRLQWADLRRIDPDGADALDPAKITLDRLQALRNVRATELAAASDVLDQHKQDANALNLYAPLDGVVRDVYATPGSAVRGGILLVSLESDEAPAAIGWASERLAETLYVGMPATVGYNLGGDKLQASGAIIDLRAGEDPTRPGEFGIIVTVASETFDNPQVRRSLNSGAPVNVVAEKQLAKRAIASADNIYRFARARVDTVVARLKRGRPVDTVVSSAQ